MGRKYMTFKEESGQRQTLEKIVAVATARSDQESGKSQKPVAIGFTRC